MDVPKGKCENSARIFVESSDTHVEDATWHCFVDSVNKFL